MLEFDEQITRSVEALYVTPDLIAQRRATRAVLSLRPGESVLDIGSGPGLLTSEMAAEVGPEGRVFGVDPSESMLGTARRRDARVEYRIGDALALPFPDEHFDVVVSTQVYEYVPDIAAALAEARRVLRPGGRLLVLDTDWDSIVWHSVDQALMQRVLSAWNDHLADPFLPRQLPRLLRAAGFELAESTIIPILNLGADPDTLSAGIIGLVATYVPGHGGVNEADVAAWKQNLADLGDDYFFSLNRYLFLARRT